MTTDAIALQYGIPPRILGGVVWVEDTPVNQSPYVAQQLNVAYSKSNDWQVAVGDYFASGPNPHLAAMNTQHALEVAGILSPALPTESEGKKWYEDWIPDVMKPNPEFLNVGDSRESFAQKFLSNTSLAVLGVAVVVLAVIASKNMPNKVVQMVKG